MRAGEIKTFSALAIRSTSAPPTRSIQLITDEWGTEPNTFPATGNDPFKFSTLRVSHLQVKIDGHHEHYFTAILNGEAAGMVIAMKQPCGACGLRMLFVTPKHRHKGIGSRLVSRVQVFAHNEGCTSIQLCVHKGNAEARKFWIRRRFIDMGDEDDKPEYTCMTREIPTP